MAGIAKGYALPFDYVLYDMSYANMIMYGAVIPSYNPKDKKKEDKRVIKADDPRNRQQIRDLLNMED